MLRFGLLAICCGCALRGADLTLSVEPRWQGAPIAVPSGEVTNAHGQTLRITRLAMLISEVGLRREDGSLVRLGGQFGLWDIERGRTTTVLRGVPEGRYSGIEFQIGLPPAVNHGDPGQWPARHALNPLVNGLHWSWQGGYVFFALEGRWRAGEARSADLVRDVAASEDERGFLYHLATDARRMSVRFAAEFAVEGKGGPTMRLALDLARVLKDVRLAADDGSESTHSGEGDGVAVRLAATVERAWFWLGMDGRSALTRRATSEVVAGTTGSGTPVVFTVPAGFPQPELPADNPLTAEGVALGRALFSDTRLSGNGTQSCVSCHAPERAFSDAVAVSVGAEGKHGARNAMPLFNLAWSETYAWDGGQARVRDQALAAMRNPIEMNAEPERVVIALAGDARMRAGFAAAFGSEEVTAERIGLAFEQYLLTLVDADSRFDRALRGGGAELTEEEKRGFELFMTEYDPARGRRGADCFHCHGGALFTDFGFKNNGLAVARGRIGDRDRGREGVTGKVEDRMKFKTPSLRNVALTAPYMHDGRFATLGEVVAHYDHGVERSATLDANLAKHPAEGLRLTAEDQRALVAFLRTLTDARYEGRAD